MCEMPSKIYHEQDKSVRNYILFDLNINMNMCGNKWIVNNTHM